LNAERFTATAWLNLDTTLTVHQARPVCVQPSKYLQTSAVATFCTSCRHVRQFYTATVSRKSTDNWS